MKENDDLWGQGSALTDEVRASLLFLTRLPPRWIGGVPAVRPDFTAAARTFPIAGAIVGAIGGAVLILAWLLALPPLVAAVLGVTATVVVTGAIHEDGLADSADAFGGTTREERFAILDDSRIGTFGAIAVAISLLLRASALAAIFSRGPLAAALALVAAEAVSRTAMVRQWHDLPAARGTGLSVDTGTPDTSTAVTAIAIAVAIVVVLGLPALGWRAAVLASILAVVAGYAANRITARTFGGRTGDTLGACQQLTLAAFLAGASAA